MKRVEIEAEAGDGVDRISALPAHLKECILEFVSMKDAMKTSVLSSKWRYCWTRMRKLDLIVVERNNVRVFRRAIDRILLLHSGPIREFKLSVPRTRNRHNFNLSDWFYVLSENGIQDIEIDGFDSHDIDGLTVLLPSSLFHCRDLKTLGLDRCNLSPPLRFVGFSNILSLYFNWCTVPSLVLGSFISQCPLLEKLSLTYTHTQNNNQPLVINALNLRTVFFEDELLGGIIFENVPKLTYVKFSATEIIYTDLGMPPGSWPRICSLSGIMALEFNILSLGVSYTGTSYAVHISLPISLFIENLKLIFTNTQYTCCSCFAKPMIGECPSCLPSTLENLKTLILTTVNACVEDDVRFMLCLIRSSPGLQDLTILFDNIKTKGLPKPDNFGEAAQKLLEIEAGEHGKLSNLLVVIFQDIEGLSHEMLLVKIMLSRCPYLKSFKISPDYYKTTKDVRKSIKRELKEFPKKDKLIYCKDRPDS